MYLKRLEIKGFKSFADKADFEFLKPTDGRNSVTAIVGPNGAGKSNVSDALRWVMGEQSLKNIRGKKNEDVIFGGSQNRGHLSSAEVCMTLDNSDRKFLADFDEISITRRLFRSGEAEYLINNKPVRLLDIHLLLAKAQFAQHSYSIIGQGTIDRLLTVGPAERKDFLDEASGIKEYQIKQHQAELKLARTRENINQAQTLMREVEPRLKILAKQVKKLEKRQEVEKDLREFQERHYASLFLANKNELEKITANLNEIDGRYRRIFSELETAQTALATLARAQGRQEAFKELQVQYELLLKEKNDLERQAAIKDGQMHAGYNAAGKTNISWLKKKIAELKLRRDSLNSELTLARQEQVSANRLLGDKEVLLSELTSERAQVQINIVNLEKQALSDQSEQHYRQFSGLTAVQAVLENKNKFGKVYGLVSELADAEEKYRVALETAAGSYLSSIVVEDEETARKAIEFLRANRLGQATFLPLTKIKARPVFEDTRALLSEGGALGLAIDLIKFENKFADVFSFVFGQSIIVEDLHAAKRIGIGRARMATLDGDLCDKNGVMKGGFSQHKRAGWGFSRKMLFSQDKFAEFQSRIILEKEKAEATDKRLETEKAELLKLEAKKESANSRAAVLEGEAKNLESEVASLEQELALASADPKDHDSLVAKLAAEKIELEKAMAAKQEEVEKISNKIENFNRQEEEKKQKFFALQTEMQKKQDELNVVLGSRNDLKVESAKLETKQDSIVQEVRAEMNTAIEAIVERAPEPVAPESMSEILAEIQKLKYQLSLIGGIDEEVVGEYSQTKEKYDFLENQITDLDLAIKDLEKMVLELDDIMKKKRASAFKKIKKEFDRFVKILFGGGSAEMNEIYGAPEDEASLENGGGEIEQLAAELEAQAPSRKEKVLVGIDIMINPPGKKIRNINTLSGGERTLASIALICAVLNYNPSPFVVLDEVEAALDETNTRRFAQILDELRAQSQFIIITHNRVTMHAADALYGVVMGTDGVSKLLSVKMEDAGKFEQANVDKKVEV